MGYRFFNVISDYPLRLQRHESRPRGLGWKSDRAMPVTEHTLECDLLVAGGGIAGVCCALAAARLGCAGDPLPGPPVLGGNASSEVRMHIVGATGLERRRGAGDGAARGRHHRGDPARSRRAESAALALADGSRCFTTNAAASRTSRCYLNTTVVSAEVEDGLIREVRAETAVHGGRFIIRAKHLRGLHGRWAARRRGGRAVHARTREQGAVWRIARAGRGGREDARLHDLVPGAQA